MRGVAPALQFCQLVCSCAVRSLMLAWCCATALSCASMWGADVQITSSEQTAAAELLRGACRDFEEACFVHMWF